MKIKNTFLRAFITISQSKWRHPAVLTLVVGGVLFGITDCKQPHH